MAKLESLPEIFNQKLFRIPDYQRGYSWEVKHLEALWQDIENLTDKLHYTGTITVELISDEEVKHKLKDDSWLIDDEGFKPFYVVDGQQRLTTFIILISVIAEKLKDDEEFFRKTSDKFLYTQNHKKSLKSYLFGYEVDNPSYEFFKTQILGQESSKATEHLTVYTSNLKKAKQFFENKLKGFDIEDLEKIYKKITQKFKFDFNVIDQDLDIFLVFETMNNRGKHLSNLEILKNRLIYLSTLLPNYGQKEKDKLRSEINDTWKTLYEYLGKDSKRPLNDDEFLRIHWIMYCGYSKEAEFYRKQILEDVFTVKKLIDKELTYADIRTYVDSLRISVKAWYNIKNPLHAVENSMIFLEADIAKWLEKLHRLGFTMFEPLMLAVFTSEPSNIYILDFVKQVEKYIFVRHTFSRFPRNSSHQFPYPQANMLYIEKDKGRIWAIINEKIKIEGRRSNRFTDDILNYIDHYYSWDGLKYFLHEYEEHLQKQHKRDESKVNWELSKDQSTEHILPQNPLKGSEWWSVLNKIKNEDNRHKLKHSLGNLMLVSKSINSELSNKSFELKKKDGNIGYFTGSYSEIEVSQYEHWDDKSILDRGLKMLAFLEYRWNIYLGTPKEKKEILLLDFVK